MHSRTARGRMAALVVFVAVLAGAVQASAAVSPNPIVRPFTVRYAINTNGDIAMAANTLLTCPTGALETQTHVGCADVQTGGFGDDNYFDMRYVDVDGDASTFDSSSANLTFRRAPPCSSPASTGAPRSTRARRCPCSATRTSRAPARPRPTPRRRPLPCCRARAPAATSRSAPACSTPTPRISHARWAASTSARATRASPT